MESQLTEETFISFCMHHYDKSICTLDEFNEDLNRIKTIQRCLSKYDQTKELNERLILNHIVITYNLFNDAATDILLFKVKKEQWSLLRPFLLFINRDHDKLSDIPIDMNIADRLRRI